MLIPRLGVQCPIGMTEKRMLYVEKNTISIPVIDCEFEAIDSRTWDK